MTFTPRNILVPTDFSELSTVALHYANEIATRFAGSLTVIYADRFGPAEYLEVSPEYFEDLPALKERAAATLNQYLTAQLPSGTKREEEIVIDFPVPGILKSARSHEAELIVMGTHGRTGLKRALLGSIAEGVLHGSNLPVMTIRHKEGDPVPESYAFRRILCPVNFTEVAHDALGHAASFARAFGCELIVLHVVESLDQVVQHDQLLEKLREWIPDEIRGKCDYKELVIRGRAAEQIIEFAKKMNIDLIVIGAQHQTFSDATVIGTTTERITRYAFCPVLTVTREVGAENTAESRRFMEPIGL